MNSECRRTSRAFGGNGGACLSVRDAHLQIHQHGQEGGCYAPKI